MAFVDPKEPTRPDVSLHEPPLLNGCEEAEICVSNATAGARFACIDCDAVLTVPETLFFARPFETHCPNCDRPISIQLIHSAEAMEVVELFGCEYAGTLPRLPQAHPPIAMEERSVLAKETFVDDLIQQWEVNTRAGQNLRFNVFAEFREAVTSGRIERQDVVISPDGRSFRVEEFPGTADLFGNNVRRMEAAHYLYPRSNPSGQALPSLARSFSRALALTLVSIGLAFFTLAVPRGLKWWNLREGTHLVYELTAGVRVAPFTNLDYTLVEARDALRQNRPELLPDAITKFLQVLSAQPQNVSALTGLAEAWVESYASSPDRLAWENAGRLIKYAGFLAPDSADVTRAGARQLWKAGRRDEAIARLESLRDLLETDPASRMLLARMAVEADDFSKATIHLHEALKTDPGNLSYLLTFADVFERQGKFAEAASYVQKALAVSTNPQELLPRLAALYRSGKELDSAEAIYRQLVNTASPREEDLHALIDLLASQERLQEVISRANEYLSRFPGGVHAGEVRSFRQLAVARTSDTPPPPKSKHSKKRRSRAS